MIEVASVIFGDDGSVLVSYVDASTDVRNRGLLVKAHQLQISPGDGSKDYQDEIEDVRDAIMRLLHDALEDFSTLRPDEEIAANESSQQDV